MKLHLPTRLRAAVLACFAVVTSFTTTLATGVLSGGAFAVSLAAVSTLAVSGQAQALSATTVAGFDTGADYTGTGFTYTAETGLLSGAGLANDITFDLKYDDLQPSQWFIYTDSGSAQWGLGTTADGNIRGYWNPAAGGQIAEWNNGSNPTCLLENVSSLAAEGAETVQLTAEMSGLGVALAAGGFVSVGTAGNLFNCSSLHAGSSTPNNSYVDKSVITRLYVADTAGTYTRYTAGGFGVVLAADAHVNATAERVELDGGASGSAATTSATRNPIFVGGAGQLFLQAWGQGAINLDNDIYLGASTYTDVASHGVLRFGNDGGADNPITLNGSIIVLEDTSIKANGSEAVNINGTITDKQYINGLTSTGGKTLTVRGQGYTLSGRVDVSNVVLLDAAGVNFGGEVAVGDLTLNGNSSATFSGSDARLGALSTAAASTLTVAEGANLTLGGTVELGAAIVNNGTLTFVNDVQLNLSGLSAADGVYTLFTGNEVAGFAGLSVDNITGINTVGYDWLFNVNGTIARTINSESYIYSGGALNWDTTSASFAENKTFVNNGVVVFSGNSTVSLAENLTASCVVIEEGVSVALSGSGNNLTATQLQLDGTLVLNDNALNAASRVAGAGNLHIGGEVIISDRATLSGFTNTITVLSGGVLKAGGAANGTTGIFGNTYGSTGAPVIVVETGGMVDIDGRSDVYYKVILKEGATYANTSSNGISDYYRQLPVLVLEGDATITANAELGMRAATDSSGVPVLTLNGHTLTKNGSGTFFLFGTRADAGTILVEAGTLDIRNGGTYTNTNINVGAGASLTTSGATLNGTVTVGAGATFQANGATYTGTSVTLAEGGSMLYRTGANSTFKAFNTTGAATFDAADNSSYSMTVTDASVIGGRLTKTNVGGLIWSNSVELTDGIDIQQGSVTFNGAAKVSGTLTVASGATLNVGDSGSVIVGNLAGFTVTTTEPEQNGLASVNYRILDNSGTSNITSVSYNGSSYTLTDGILSLSDLYYVISDTVTAGGSSATVDTDRAIGFVVKNGATLDVQGDAGSALNVHRIVTTTSGSGTMILRSSTTLKDGDATVFAGDLEIASGTQLSLGANSAGGGTTAQTASITSLNSVILNGGTLFVRGVGGNLGTIVSKEGSTGSVLQIYDMAGADGAASGTLSMDKLELNADTSLRCNWKSNIDIAQLSGSGNLAAQHYFRAGNGDREDCGDTVNLNISSLLDYSGAISMIGGDKGLDAPVNMNISTGAAGVTMKGISITNSTLNLTVEGATSMSEGLKLIGENFNGVRGSTATIAIAPGANFSGAVIVEGAGNTLTSSQGGMNLSQLNVKSGATLDLNGAVSALLMNQAGTVNIADMVLTDGAVLTYGDAANLLSVTDGMLAGNVVIGSGLTLTEAGVNLGLSSAIAQEKIGISNYADGTLQVVGDSWYLRSTSVTPPADNVLLVGAGGVDYDSAEVTGKDTIRLAGGELCLGDTDVAAAFTTLETTAAGGSIIANGTEAEVSFGTVTIADNATVTLKDGATDLTLKAGALNLGTDSGIVLEAGQVLDLTAIDNMDDEDTGKFSKLLNATSGAGTLKVSMPGEFRMKTNTTLSTNLEAAQLKLNSWGTGGRTLTVMENGSISLTGNLIMQSTSKTLVAGGSVTADKIVLGYDDTTDNPGHLEMSAGSIETKGIVGRNVNNTFNMSGGTLTITSADGIGNGIITTITGGTLATDGADWGVNGATVGGVSVQGENTITLTNATLTGSIDNGAGKLALSGTVNVDSSAFSPLSKIVWSVDGSNGYKRTDAQYNLVSAVANLTADGVTSWKVDDSTTGVSYADGVVVKEGTVETDVFWVNAGTVAYSAADTSIVAETTAIKLNGNSSDGADTLQLNSSLREGLSITAQSGSSTTINLNGTNVELDAAQLGDGVSASTVTLTGNGKYIQTPSNSTLKIAGLSDADNWLGTVVISGNYANVTPDKYGNSNSFVEFKGFSGHWQQHNTVFNTNIVLTNAGDDTPAIKITNGYGGAVLQFNGSISGTGDIWRNTGNGSKQTYVFAGDVSGWSGSFKNTWTGNETIVKFTGGSDIKASFDRGQGANGLYNLQVVVDNTSGNPDPVEMSGSITATSLTVAQGTTVQITGPLALDGALTTDGITQLAGDVANGITLGQVAGTGALEILTGDLTLTAKSDFHTLAMAADSKLNLDLNTLGVTDLKNWSTGPMLTLDTLRSDGALSISALVDGAALLTLADGESKTLAQITNCNTADLTLLVNGAPDSVLEKESDGFKYEYKLVKEGDSAQVLITASRVSEGWVAQDTDPNSLADTTWTDGDLAGDGKWAGEGTVGKFYGFGEGTVNIEDDGVTIADSVVISAVSGTTEYTFAGGALNAAELYVTEGKLTIDNAGVTATGDAVLSHDSELTVNEKLTVGGDMGVLDSAGLGNSGTVEVLGTLSVADGAEVSNAGTLIAGSLDAAGAEINSTGTLQTAGGTIGSLTGNGTLKNSGSLTILESTVLTSFSNSGSLIVEGDLSVASPIAQGGTVQADNITVGGNAVFTKVTTGKLTADSVMLTDAQITTLDTAQLMVHGNVTVEEKTSLKNLVGPGKLTVANTLTLEETVSSSVDVTASALELAAGGNELGSVQTDMVSMAEGTTLSRTKALLTVEDITALSGETVGISVSDSAFGALAMDGYGRYVAADYLIINGAASADAFSYVNTWQLQEILSTGVSAELAVTGGVLSLRISAVTDAGGEEVGMIWDTRNETANNGYVIDRGERFYRSLDYVHAVQVREDTLFDLTEAGVGDAVAGNASVPAMGLTVRNLSGGSELTVKGDGVAADTVTFLNTENMSPAEAVQLNADAVFVNLGAPEGVKGMMEGDADSFAPLLKSMALHNRAVASVNRDTEVLGETELGDYTRLMVQEGSVLTTGMLSGTDEAEISGEIRVLQGGVYTGAYDEARIIAADGSKLFLRTGGRRSLGLQAQSGSYVSLDGVGMDGRMSYLRVGQAPLARMAEDGTAELNILNTTVTDTGVEHSTIMLTAQEGNYINKSAVRLSLGAAETARTLGAPGAPVVIDGTVDVTDSSITVNMMGNAAENGVLEVNTDAAENLTLARFVTSGTVQGNTVTLTGTPEMLALLGKYYTNARLESDGAIKVDRVTDYYASRLPVAENAQVGIGMADAALVKLNPQAKRSELGELAGVLDALDTAVASGNTAAAAELGAAVSGASTAALGAAVAGDLERQLMSVRNRTTTMGVDQSRVNENMPYFNAWINAEGDFRRMDEDGMAAGYELSSWGGTVGFDVDVTPRLTMGIAATAMYGDFTAESADHAEGDLDTYYVTAFGRYAANRWSHTFVASVGMADTSLKRTVSHSHGSYSAEGDAEGTSFGFLYELGYVLALNETATACLQPIFNVMLTHSSLDGYAEEGGDAALRSSGVDMTAVTFGLGARAQAMVGANLYNRSSLVETRALLKLRTGDREAETENGLVLVPGTSGSVKAAEMGVIGLEFGAGITIPLGADGAAVFADAAVEVGGGFTNVNGTIGFRFNF